MFTDFNLKLSVISALHDLGYYTDEAKKISDAQEDWENPYSPIPAVLEYYQNLELSADYLAEIETLNPDGGDLVYQFLTTSWDGEDEQFDISSLEGIEQLVNLKSFAPSSMIISDGLDYAPLLACPKLESVDAAYLKKDIYTFEVVREFRAKGIDAELREFDLSEDFKILYAKHFPLLEKVENYAQIVSFCTNYYDDSLAPSPINIKIGVKKEPITGLQKLPYPKDFLEWHASYGNIELFIGQFVVRTTQQTAKRLEHFATVLTAHNYLYLTQDRANNIYVYDLNDAKNPQIMRINADDYYATDDLEAFYLAFYGGCSYDEETETYINPYLLDTPFVFDEANNYNIKSLYIQKIIQEKMTYICDTFFELLVGQTLETFERFKTKYGVFHPEIKHYLGKHWGIPYNKGVDYYKNKQLDLAEKEFLRSVAIKPNAHSYSNLGQIYDKKGQKEAAITYFETGIEVNPRYPLSHNNLAFLYYSHKEYDLAYDTIVYGLQCCREHATSYLTKAEICFELDKMDEFYEALVNAAVLEGDPKDCASKIEKALKKESEYKAVLQMYAAGLAEVSIDTDFIGRIDCVNDDLNRAVFNVKTDADDFYNWKRLADELFEINDFKNALNAYETAKKWGDKAPDFYFLLNLGACYNALDNVLLAKYYFHKVSLIFEQDSRAVMNLSIIYFRAQNPKKGFHFLAKTLAANPNKPGVYASYGYYLLFYGDYKKATPFIDTGIVRGNASNSYLNRGHVYLIEQQTADAVIAYARSFWGFRNAAKFWADFKSDYAALEQYNISKAAYLELIPRIAFQIEKGCTTLEDYAALWSKSIKKYDAVEPECLDKLEAMAYPNVFVDWIKLGNHTYSLPIPDEDADDYKLRIFNTENIEEEAKMYDFLAENDYLIFAETLTGECRFYAFDTQNNNKIVYFSSDLYDLDDIYTGLENDELMRLVFEHNPDLKFENEAKTQLKTQSKYVRNYIETHLADAVYENFEAFLKDKSQEILDSIN